ncbi:MAG: fibronectin type III domain-containing protein [Steroidobacteraceae bacterium]
MTDNERGRGSHRGIYLFIVAALGFALAGCGGGGSSSAAGSAPESSSPTQQAAPAPGDTSSTAPAQGVSGGSDTSGGPTGAIGSGTTGSDPPTASAGSVTLNWLPPTENVDDTPLTNLAGYDIHYGTASGKYTQTITISNPGIATYVVQNLTPGTYYFSVAAVNSDGTESPMSSEVSTTVS